jgi:hypothetical protein
MCDILILAWAIHKVYHSKFRVFYVTGLFGPLVAIGKELLGTFILSAVLVIGGSYLLGLSKDSSIVGALIYSIVFFAISIFLIIRYRKPKQNEQIKN